MKPRFIKWILLLLLLTIVATEGLRGPESRVNDGKVLAVRARGGSRFSSRKSGSSESTSEETPQNPDSKSTTKPSRFTATRKTTPAKSFGRHSTASSSNGGGNSGSAGGTPAPSKSTTEHNLPKSRIEAALQRRADKLKVNPLKPHPHGLRVPIRKLGQKGHTPEPEKSTTNNTTESGEDGDDSEDRRYLPDGLSEEAKNAKDEEEAEGFETPKVSENSPPGSQKNIRFNGNRSKQKLDNNSPSATGTTVDNSRLRTGRKIQSQTVLSPKQLKTNVPSSSRFTKAKENDEEAEVELTTDTAEAGSVRRSFEVEPPRKKSNDKPDISASESENVRINIPLSFEESKKIGSSGNINDSTDEVPKRPSSLRFKSRSRPTLEDKKLDSNTSTTSTTTASSIRGVPRRVKVSKGHESSTEATTARTRARHYESKKSNTISDVTSTTAQPDLGRRRNFKNQQKPTTKNPENNVVHENKNHNLNSQPSNSDNKKLNSRLRGRYRTEVTTDTTSQTTSNTAFIQPTVGTNYGVITPSYVPEVIVTTSSPPTTSTPTTVRYIPQPSTVAATTYVEATKKDDESEEESQENGQKRRSSKEDFFNHGLGFRGRRPPIPGIPDATPAAITSTISTPTVPTTPRIDNSPRGNPGWTLRRRPGHWSDGQTFGPSANPSETLPPADQDGRITTIIPPTTTIAEAGTTQKAARRGNKAFTKAINSGGKQDESTENDNYPPDFKERIAQLQKTGGPPKTQTEEPQLQTSSNVTGSASADLELAPSENEYLLVTQTAHPISSTTLSLQIPSNLEEQQVRDI